MTQPQHQSKDPTAQPSVIRIPNRIIDSQPHIKGIKEYEHLYELSLHDTKRLEFWKQQANSLLKWDEPFTKIMNGSLAEGSMTWFEDGSINASVNCIDRHAKNHPDKVAIIYEGDEPNSGYSLTYQALLEKVCQLANGLKSLGIKKGDTVTIYMPNGPEAITAVMACTRLGIVHSVVFGGFSSHALADRIQIAKSQFVITADQTTRGKKPIHLKKIADQALKECPDVKHVIVLKKTRAKEVPWQTGRDIWWHDLIEHQSSECSPANTKSEDALFLLFTSGSTGTPKGLLHTTGGYLLGAAMTTKYLFDGRANDVFFCTADIGWITGHSYITYGPLLLGMTTLVFDGIPTYPNPSRYWDIVTKHKVTQLYTSPTALRSLKQKGDEHIKSTPSLRILGSVGEPIDPTTWLWFFDKIGQKQCSLVDTYWQTETGSIILSPIPGATDMKPGSCFGPMLGIKPELLNEHGNLIDGEGEGQLVISQPWPSMARSCFGDHQRFNDTYLNPNPGYYTTGDRAYRDSDGYLWIRGRVDDVINVSGHRLTTSELESILSQNSQVATCAVVGIPDKITGQSLQAFITINDPKSINPSKLITDLQQLVKQQLGSFAVPKQFHMVDDVPKTRSGKILRRLLKKILMSPDIKNVDELGDLSMVANPSVLGSLLPLSHKL